MVRFPHLLAPGRIGELDTRNRLLLCPMGDTLGSPGGWVSDRQVAYYEARARGGVGVILVGSVAVAYPDGSYDARQLGLSDDAFVPGLRRLAERAHAHGALIAAQLVHDGGNSLYDIERGAPVLVPSPPTYRPPDRLSRMVTAAEADAMSAPLRGPNSRYEPRVATEADIAWVVDRFAAAAARAVHAGFDGIEIHAGHGYLVDAFLSPVTNSRDDEWGGPVANRARLLCEVIVAVRQAVGPGVAVWCRINGEERLRPGGETVDDALAVAGLAVQAGADAIHVSAYGEPSAAIGITEAHTPHRPGALVGLAAAVKAAVTVPVITFGRLEPDEAEAVLARGDADFVAMGRKLLADPELPRKLAAGRVDDVRPCIYQYRCIGNIFVGEPVACVANPATGHEHELAEVTGRTGHPRRVMVVGGGPAGLEATRLLAARGHDVTLYERLPVLGGALALAARTDEALDRFLGWLLRSVDQAGADLHLGEEVDLDAVKRTAPDAVVVAVGATWTRPDILGATLPHVVTPDALAGWLGAPTGRHDEVGPRVVILGGGKAALSLAAECRRRGRHVTVLEPSGVPAQELGLPGRFRLVHDLMEMGVEVLTGAAAERISRTGVTFRAADGAGVDSRPADTVVLTGGRAPRRELARSLHSLDGSGIALLSVGDCARDQGFGIEAAMADAAALVRHVG